MSRTRILQFDRWIGERKYGIYAGIMVATAICMIAMQKPLPKNAVASGQYGTCADAPAPGVASITRERSANRADLDRTRDGAPCEPAVRS